MKKALEVLVVPISAWIVLAAFLPADGHVRPAGDDASPECEEARRTNGWCAARNAGYVASVEIRSRALYEALDAHGHSVDPSAITCETCRKAVRAGGFCAAHRMGYVGGLAYLSPLTYHLARGRPIDPAGVTCPVCRRNTQGIGWCDKHHLGIAGRTAVDDPGEFKELEGAYRLLTSAVEVSARCETCAAAMVADGYCAIHRLKYKDGVGAPLSKAP